MIDIYPIVLFCTIGGVWFCTAWSAGRLHNAFCGRFPLIAEEEIPHAFDPRFKTPEKLIFYFRRRAVELLRHEPKPWRKRQRFVLLCILSLAIPVLGFLGLAILAFVNW